MTTKRFGSRYGRKVKNRLSEIEKLSKKKQFCPQCRRESAKRVSLGIYVCSKCSTKFAGRAYYLEKPRAAKEVENG